MKLFARWREPAPQRINDVAVYEERADAWWNDGDPVFAPLHAMTRPRLLFLERTLPVPLQGARVADVGAGGGYVAIELAARGARVVAVDLAPAALRAALGEAERRALAAQLGATVASADALPLASSSCELVVCSDVLVHISDPALRARALDEIARLVAPGGCAYIASMNRTALARFFVITLAEDILGIVGRGTHDYATFIRPAELSDEMRKRGLVDVAVEGVGAVGLRWRGSGRGLVFGRSPLTSVMYHALFRRPA